MPSDNDSVEIVLCLGSSCFARGNAENLTAINRDMESPASAASVRVTGSHCQDQCMKGPNLTMGGVPHHGVTTAKLRELLQPLGSPLGEDHGTP
jgi:NADH:ubiquinone oxidoreductase subunit E